MVQVSVPVTALLLYFRSDLTFVLDPVAARLVLEWYHRLVFWRVLGPWGEGGRSSKKTSRINHACFQDSVNPSTKPKGIAVAILITLNGHTAHRVPDKLLNIVRLLAYLIGHSCNDHSTRLSTRTKTETFCILRGVHDLPEPTRTTRGLHTVVVEHQEDMENSVDYVRLCAVGSDGTAPSCTIVFSR